MVGRWTGGLDDEDIFTANILVDFHEGLSVGKGGDSDIGKWTIQGSGDVPGERIVGGSGEKILDNN